MACGLVGAAASGRLNVTKGLRLILLAALVAGCSQPRVLEKVASPEDRAFAVRTLKQLEAGDLKGLQANVPDRGAQQLASVVPRMRAKLPGAGKSEKLLVDLQVRSRLVRGERRQQAYLAYELRQSDKYALAQIVIERSAARAQLRALNVNRLESSTSESNSFSLKRKGWPQYLMLALAVASLGVTVGALVKIWRDGSFRRRWLWTLGVLFGLTSLSVNWETGEFSFSPFSVQLFSASDHEVRSSGPMGTQCKRAVGCYPRLPEINKTNALQELTFATEQEEPGLLVAAQVAPELDISQLVDA